jgi:hypothetical protein
MVESRAQIAVGDGVIGTQADCFLEELDGIAQLSGIKHRNTEAVARHGALRTYIQTILCLR